MKTDVEIQTDVMNELKWKPFLNASAIGVAVKKGVVTLSGQVQNYEQKIAAEKAAKQVTGVRAIAEEIQIGVSPISKKTDTEIAEAVLEALKWRSAVPEKNIQVKVEDGIVTLEGQVDWYYQSASARNAVVGLLGVRDVINNIRIKPQPVSETEIKNQISSALQRSASIDAEQISIDVNGTKVVLYGKVRSVAEKEDAEEAAWCSPGVSKVESHISVEPQPDFVF